MASTNSSTKYSAQQPVSSTGNKQAIRTRVEAIIKSSFANTLGQFPDMVNIFMALIYNESTFNFKNSKGPNYGRSHLDTILGYSAIKNFYASATQIQKSNIINSAAAYGLAQVTGYYLIKGCGPKGQCELERLRPDLASQILVNPGEDVSTKLWGDSNIDNQITAGLIVLEGKLKEVAPNQVKIGRYSNLLSATIGSYLGSGNKDSLDTTPEKYANDIIRGDAYSAANNGATGSSSNGTAATSPDKTSASGNNLSMAGC